MGEIGAGTLIVLALAVYFAPALIEMLGPVEGDKETIRRAKRQISTIISSALAILTALLAQGGWDVINEESIAVMVVGYLGSKTGIQGLHDSHWTDKNVVQLQKVRKTAAEKRDLAA